MQNSVRFQTTSDFDREYLQNGSRYPKSERRASPAIPSAFNEKSPMNFGPVITENYVSLNPLKLHFRETIFRPLGGAAPQILTRTTDWPSLGSAHPNGDEVPPPKKN